MSNKQIFERDYNDIVALVTSALSNIRKIEYTEQEVMDEITLEAMIETDLEKVSEKLKAYEIA